MSKWTPERLKKDRESWEAKNNSRATNRTASTGTAAGTANTTDKWTPERIAKARESWEAKSSGQNAASRLRLQGRTPARVLVHGCWRR